MLSLSLLEALLLVAGLLYVWKRARPATPPYGAPLGWLFLALIGQAAVLVLADLYLEAFPREPELFTRQLPRAMWTIWGFQLARDALLLLALGAWFRIVKPELNRKIPGGAFFAALLLFLIPDSFSHFAGSVTLFIVLVRMKWSEELHGLMRFIVLLVSVICFFLLSFDVTAIITPTGFDISLLAIGDSGDQSIITGPVPEIGLFPHQLTSVWNHGIRITVFVLRMAAMVAFFKLLVVPISLRGLSLSRRFTMTFVLFRVIPAFLGLVATILIIYFGAGWQRARIARMVFNDTISRNLMVAGSILEKIAPFVEKDLYDTATPPYDDVRRWLGPDSLRAHFVVRRFHQPADGRTGGGSPDRPVQIRSTPGTPVNLTAHSLFDSWDQDSIAGLFARNGNLYLAAGCLRPDRKACSEVYVIVDSLFLDRVIQYIAADIRLEVKPKLFITATSITSDADSAWTDRALTLTASQERGENETGLLRRTNYLARTFLPAGDWLHTREDVPAGVISLALYTSLERIFRQFAGEPYFLSSNSIPIVMLAVILILFFFAELSAVRTGRSIARGILEDVKLLASATRRFGEGDLDHRLPVHGRDELSTLASSFNTMAKDIQKHQEVLLEKERLEADLAVAREIQQRMLPQEPPVVPGLDVAGISIPSREVGGDLFSFLTLPNGNLGFALGDVSGKSVPAALLMSNTVAALKAETRVDAAADHVLDQMNKMIADQVEPGKFVTFFYGIVDQAAGGIHYSCAGHNPPLKMNAAGEVEWIAEAGLPLGVFPDAEYTSAMVPFQSGDIFVLYSDGVTEAECAPADSTSTVSPPETANETPDDDEFFGETRMETVVRSVRHESAGKIIESLLDAIRRFSGDAPQSDDVTIIVVKHL